MLLGLLADGIPRTFNRIAVELFDHTADIVYGSPIDRRSGTWSTTNASSTPSPHLSCSDSLRTPRHEPLARTAHTMRDGSWDWLRVYETGGAQI